MLVAQLYYRVVKSGHFIFSKMNTVLTPTAIQNAYSDHVNRACNTTGILNPQHERKACLIVSVTHFCVIPVWEHDTQQIHNSEPLFCNCGKLVFLDSKFCRLSQITRTRAQQRDNMECNNNDLQYSNGFSSSVQDAENPIETGVGARWGFVDKAPPAAPPLSVVPGRMTWPAHGDGGLKFTLAQRVWTLQCDWLRSHITLVVYT